MPEPTWHLFHALESGCGPMQKGTMSSNFRIPDKPFSFPATTPSAAATGISLADGKSVFTPVPQDLDMLCLDDSNSSQPPSPSACSTPLPITLCTKATQAIPVLTSQSPAVTVVDDDVKVKGKLTLRKRCAERDGVDIQLISAANSVMSMAKQQRQPLVQDEGEV